jgi:hypothetical protein
VLRYFPALGVNEHEFLSEPSKEKLLRRHPSRRGKAALGAASIQDSFNSLLTVNEESSRGSHDLRRHGLQIVFPHEPKWNAVTEFKVQARKPGLDHNGIFSFGEHPDQLEGKPQTLFRITVKLASVHPPINSSHVPNTDLAKGGMSCTKMSQLMATRLLQAAGI